MFIRDNEGKLTYNTFCTLIQRLFARTPFNSATNKKTDSEKNNAMPERLVDVSLFLHPAS